MRVLLTRPRADSETTAAELARHGHNPIISPILEIRPAADRLDLEGVGAIAMTSANAVTALAGLTGDSVPPIFAVGSRTAEAVQRAGFPLAEIASGSVKSLVETIAASWEPGKGVILHLSGREVRGDLVGDLKALGFGARRQVAYEARAVDEITGEARQALQCGEIDAVLFFSPRTAEIFTSLAEQKEIRPNLAWVNAVCLSRAVAQSLNQSDWNLVVVAPHSDLSAMIATLDGLGRETSDKA